MSALGEVHELEAEARAAISNGSAVLADVRGEEALLDAVFRAPASIRIRCTRQWVVGDHERECGAHRFIAFRQGRVFLAPCGVCRDLDNWEPVL